MHQIKGYLLKIVPNVSNCLLVVSIKFFMCVFCSPLHLQHFGLQMLYTVLLIHYYFQLQHISYPLTMMSDLDTDSVLTYLYCNNMRM